MFPNKSDFQTELILLLSQLCKIPAPSGQEEKRAAFIQNWLCREYAVSLKNSAVFTDTANNVLVLFQPQSSEPMPLFMAHTDTVFPDTEALPCRFSCENTEKLLDFIEPFDLQTANSITKIHSPGVGDDTACAAILMLFLKYYKEQLLALGKPLLFAFNSCEEGLGNLKGCRQIMKDYGHRICHVTSFDGGVNGICNHAVGSLRYELTLHTKGGHSYNDFGNRNAIQAMCELIQQLYQMPLPPTGRNTYNVGTIQGGTSVNTIAQSCSCLFEYRSDTKEHLETMKNYFLQTIKDRQEKNPDICLDFHLVGERPCMGDVDPAAQQWLTDLASASIRKISDTASDLSADSTVTIPIGAGSTDCNIPLSLGIPAICFGGLLGGGVHTREEYVTVSLLMQEGFIMEDYLAHILSLPVYPPSH